MLNKKDRARLAKMKKFVPDGVGWDAMRIFTFFTGYCHDLKAIPEKLLEVEKGSEVTAYIKKVYIDGKKGKPKKPAADKPPAGKGKGKAKAGAEDAK